MAIWAPRGVLIIHNVEGAYTHVQVRLPSQDTADGYHECGRLSLMSYHPFGKQYSIGYSRTQRINTTTRAGGNGATFVRENAPPIDDVVIGWQHGADRVQQRATDPSPDFLAADSDGTINPLATVDDVDGQLRGVVEYTESGTWPVLLLMHTPDDVEDEFGAMITDRSLYHFGRIVSPIAYDHVTGDENVAEYGRAGNLTFKGLP